MDIIGVPDWVLLMMETVDSSGHHRVPIAPHWMCNGSPYKELHLVTVSVCLCGLFTAHFCCQLYGDCPFVSLCVLTAYSWWPFVYTLTMNLAMISMHSLNVQIIHLWRMPHRFMQSECRWISVTKPIDFHQFVNEHSSSEGIQTVTKSAP